MASDLNFFDLMLRAGPVVQFVMLLLLLASLLSWTMIFDRWRTLSRTRRAATTFEQAFWSGGELAALYQRLRQDALARVGMASLFQAGFKEFLRLHNQGQSDPGLLLQGVQRAMRVALSREMDRLETQLSFLATVGSISPYIGLFGTVWGIMHAFTSLGQLEQATIAMVAPGISEALIATAMGLFAAIPAVVAFNRYSDQVERLNNRYDEFIEEFASLLQRQLLADSPAEARGKSL